MRRIKQWQWSGKQLEKDDDGLDDKKFCQMSNDFICKSAANLLVTKEVGMERNAPFRLKFKYIIG